MKHWMPQNLLGEALEMDSSSSLIGELTTEWFEIYS